MQIIFSAPPGGAPIRDLLSDFIGLCKTTSGAFVGFYCVSPHLYILIYIAPFIKPTIFKHRDLYLWISVSGTAGLPGISKCSFSVF